MDVKHWWLLFLWTLSTMHVKLYGLLAFPWITPVKWRGGTCCMDSFRLFSISPLPRSAPWRDFARPRSMATRDRWMPHTQKHHAYYEQLRDDSPFFHELVGNWILISCVISEQSNSGHKQNYTALNSPIIIQTLIVHNYSYAWTLVDI